MLKLDEWNPGVGEQPEVVGDGARGQHPDPEVRERRRFHVAYKLRIVREAAACTEPRAVGALLRREGLYSSHLSAWRKQYRAGALEGLRPKKRGPRPARALSAVEREQV